MSTEVICHGCGQPIPVADDYRRNKIQCPACGVICPVPEVGSRKPSASGPSARRQQGPAAEDLAFEELAREEAPARLQEPAAPTRDPGGPVMPRLELDEPEEAHSPQLAAEEPAAAVVPRLELEEVPEESDEDDGRPYLVVGGDEPRCPKCHKPMAEGAVVCVECGFDLRKGKKLTKQYQPLTRRWESDYSLRPRLIVFLAVHGLALAAGVTAALLAGGGLLGFLCSWVFFGVLLAFILGSYSRLDLRRDKRGRVELTRTWRVCFVPLQPEPMDVRGYEGLVTGKVSEASFWEWFILVTLLPGLITAGVWWYFTIYKDRYYVALARDHGYPETYLYMGWSEEQMRDIATTLRDVARLTYEPG